MNSFRSFLKRHKRKILYGLGLAGGGYLLYQIYQTQKERRLAWEKEQDVQRLADENVEARLREHFERLQNLSETTSLAATIYNFKVKLFEELDYTGLTEKLRQDKGEKYLTSQEKFELWEKLKILSFTRTSCALWAITVLNLYVRAQVNILGRHLFIDQARSYENPEHMENAIVLCQQRFLDSSEFLSEHGILGLISHMDGAVNTVLERKQLAETVSFSELSEIFERIFDHFRRSSPQWLNFVLPPPEFYQEFLNASEFPPAVLNSFELERIKLKQLMVELHGALSSNDFANVLEQALKGVLDAMMEDLFTLFQHGTSSGLPLAKLIAPVAHESTVILDPLPENKFANIIGSLPAASSFFALVYANVGGLAH